jgi:hypothetical protein
LSFKFKSEYAAYIGCGAPDEREIGPIEALEISNLSNFKFGPSIGSTEAGGGIEMARSTDAPAKAAPRRGDSHRSIALYSGGLQ